MSIPDRRLSVASLVNKDDDDKMDTRPSQSTSPRSAIIDAEDEKVLIAVSALGDMRGTGLVGGSEPGPSSARYWDTSPSRAATSTPSLSRTSTSSRATSPLTRSMNGDEDEEMVRAVEGDHLLARVSHLPLVGRALQVYDYSKANSRVINYGAGLVESSVKTISRPVIDRLPVEQLDEFACRQLDRLGKYGGKVESNEGIEIGDGRGRRRSREESGEESGKGEQQIEVANRSSWQTVLVEASGISAAISEENMKRLKYCLQWLQYATGRIDQQISVLQRFLSSLESELGGNPGAVVPVGSMRTLKEVKRDVVATVRQVVEVMSKYAGGALPEQARATVRSIILLLPERWASAMQQQEAEMHTNGTQGGGNEVTASMAERAARRVLTLATESLEMMRGATGVFKESLDRAEAWVERLRIIGIERRGEGAPNSPGVRIENLRISSLYGTPAGSRRELEGEETETEGGMRRRQRRRIASPSPCITTMSTAKERHYQQLKGKLQAISKELEQTEKEFGELARHLESMDRLGAIQAAHLVAAMLALVLFLALVNASPAPRLTTSIPLVRSPPPNDTDTALWLNNMASNLRSKYGVADPIPAQRRAIGSNQLVNQVSTSHSLTAQSHSLSKNADTSYFGTLAIGNPAKSFNVILDTGSSDLWVASSSCFSGCGTVPSFSASQSSSFRNLSSTFQIKYGSGGASGYLGSDRVQMAGFAVTSQVLGVVNAVTANLLQSPVSGLMGLAFSTLSTSRSMPFWETLASTNAWDQPLMAFHLTRFKGVNGASKLEAGGSFDMGFTNTSLYTGNISYVDIPDGAESFWLIPLTQITVQNQPLTVSGTVLAAIDTGTTLVGGPSDAISAIFAQIPGAQPAGPDYQGYWAYPCTTQVQVSLTFGSGPAWSINPSDFTLARIGGGFCVGAFFELNLSGSNSPTWIIGDTFLKNVYSVFRYNPPAVGFANLSALAVSQSNINAPLPSPSIGTGDVISGEPGRPWISALALLVAFASGLLTLLS
ncbi:hypothetical protein FRB99_002745 [Tulasnella sp. 403]|nr:hypothetical protein FRB99_002745 [Tulasnella sp. 403]